MRTRIARIMQDKSLSASSLAEILGVQASGISHILSGRNNPSLDFIIRFLTKFSDVNADWFIMGKGDTYKPTLKQEITDINNEKAIVIEDEQHLSEYKAALGYEPTTANKVETDLFSVCTHIPPTTPLNHQPTNTDTQDINNTSQLCKQENSQTMTQTGNKKTIKRVMIFYSDHTVDNYEYCGE